MDGSISIVADYIDQMVCGRGQTLESVPAMLQLNFGFHKISSLCQLCFLLSQFDFT